MFCPRCNHSVTPVDDRCPDCQRSFAHGTAEAVGAGWGTPANQDWITPPSPPENPDEDDTPAHWKVIKTVPVEDRRPRKRSPWPAVVALLVVAGGGAALLAPSAPPTPVALPTSAPVVSKQLPPAPHRESPAELLQEARRALAAGNWNQAIGLAELVASTGTPRQKKAALALVAQVNERIAGARQARAQPLEAPPEEITSAASEQPRLDDGPAFPTSAYRPRGADTTDIKAVVRQSEPVRPAQVAAVRKSGPAKPTAPPARRLGEQDVLPNYNRPSRYR